MPELPEVETVRRGLASLLRPHLKIQKVEVRQRSLRVPVPSNFSKKLTGQSLQAVRRRAKFLLIDTQDHTLISHLGMTGWWRWQKDANELQKHDHLLLHLTQGVLIYNDPRRFGFVNVVAHHQEARNSWLAHLGLEPLDGEFSAEHLQKLSRKRQVAVKSFIMDQKIVVGVGNIYASEALFRARIRPTKSATRVKLHEWQALVSAIQEVLKEAIEVGGTTIRDFKTTEGEIGYFHQRLKVYERDEEPCLVCQTPIRSKIIGQRSTYYCPRCQK